jgi:hypothetical protein
MNITAVRVEDLNLHVVKLPRGSYLIDGNVLTLETITELTVKDVEGICIVLNTSRIKHYEHEDSTAKDGILSVLDFEKRKEELLSKLDEDGDWESLEDEFLYRVFLKTWRPKIEPIQEISTPIKVHVVYNTVMDTGNPFIEPGFLNVENTPTYEIYNYHRPSACVTIIREVMTELGLKEVHRVSYLETKLQRIWGFSSTTGLSSIVAFGSYVVPEEYKNVFVRRGTLKECLACFEADKQTLRSHLNTQYKDHFGTFHEGSLNIDKLKHTLNQAISILESVKVIKASENYKRMLRTNLKDMQKIIRDAHTMD